MSTVAAPTNTVAPVASVTWGVGNTASVTTGTWTGTSPSYTYQWKRGGVAIVGETAATHAIVTADVGVSLTCDVTATNAAGSATASSNALSWSPQSLTPFADYRAEDVHLTSSKVDTVYNTGSHGTYDLAQSNASKRLTINSADAHFNGHDSFHGAATCQADATTASDWTAFHDGTGCTILGVGRPTGTGNQWIAETANGSGGSSGFYLAWLAATGQLKYDAGSGDKLICLSAASSVPADANVKFALTVQDTAGPDATFYVNGSSSGTANFGSAPGTSAPVQPLSIMNSNTFSVAFLGSMQRLVFLKRVITATELGLWHAWCTTVLGV